MALVDKKRAAGVRDILRRLRGDAPRPIEAEDQIEGLFKTPEEDEEVSEDIAPARKLAPPVPPRTVR